LAALAAARCGISKRESLAYVTFQSPEASIVKVGTTTSSPIPSMKFWATSFCYFYDPNFFGRGSSSAFPLYVSVEFRLYHHPSRMFDVQSLGASIISIF